MSTSCYSILIVENLLEPSCLIFFCQLVLCIKERAKLVSKQRGVCRTYWRCIAMRINFISREVHSSFKLLLIASIFDHILVIFEISRLKILLESFNLICIHIAGINAYRTIGRRLLVLCKWSLCYCVVYSWSFLKNFTVKDIFTIISLVKYIFLRTIFWWTTTIFEFFLLIWKILILLYLFLCGEFHWYFFIFIPFMSYIDWIHCLDFGKSMSSKFERIIIELSLT